MICPLRPGMHCDESCNFYIVDSNGISGECVIIKLAKNSEKILCQLQVTKT